MTDQRSAVRCPECMSIDGCSIECPAAHYGARYNERFIVLRWIVGLPALLIGGVLGLASWPFWRFADKMLPTSRRSA